jgi:DNA-binding transcriptional MocR family regulator
VAYGTRVDPELLFVTAGASSALDLLCTLYTRPGDLIFVEEPSYFLALRIFEDHGLRIVPIPMDDDGLRLDALDEPNSLQSSST